MKKIIFNRENCIGCGSCAAVCPEFWQLGDDRKANLKDSQIENDMFVKDIEEEGCNGQARDVCPVQVINIIEK